MDTKELLKKVRKIEIKTRRLSNHVFGGEYHSTFKGRGMTFSEVRQYQFGDDVRSIDWNVTARYNSPYVKVFEETKTRFDIGSATLYDLQNAEASYEIANTNLFASKQNLDISKKSFKRLVGLEASNLDENFKFS